MEKFFVLEQRWLLLLVLLLLTKRSKSCHLRLHARHLSLHRGHACYLRLQRRHTSSLRELWLHHRSVSCAVAAAVTRGERVVAVLVSKGLARKNVNSSSIIIFYSTLTCKKRNSSYLWKWQRCIVIIAATADIHEIAGAAGSLNTGILWFKRVCKSSTDRNTQIACVSKSVCSILSRCEQSI